MDDVLAIIPARAGSKGIPRKNLAECGGRPLIDWTLQAVNEAGLVTRAVLSSDMLQIRERAWGKVWPLPRPHHLAEDHSSTESVIEHAIKECGPAGIYVLLQPTSPLTEGKHIDEAIRLLEMSQADSVVSVVRSHVFLWNKTWDGRAVPNYAPQERPRRQEMQQFEENGAIYVFRRQTWAAARCRVGGRVELYEMDEEHRLQVDTPEDLEQMSRLLERRAVPA